MELSRLVGVLPHAWTQPLRLAVRRLRKVRQKLQAKQTRKFLRECNSVFSYTCRVELENFLLSGAILKVAKSNHPLLSVILFSASPPEFSFACLRALQEQRFDEMEIVIVDSESTDETARLLKRVEGVQRCRYGAGTSLLQAINHAMQKCRGDYLLLLSPGVQLLEGAIQAALNTIRTSPEIGAVGAKLILANGTLHEAGAIIWDEGSFTAYGRGEDTLAPAFNFRRKVDGCSGVFLLTPRNVWMRLDGLDERLSRSHYEVVDYCARLWEQGLQVVYEPSATGIYYESEDTEFGKSVTMNETRQQRRFTHRHASVLSADVRSGDERARILFLDDRAPHPWLGSGFPRAYTLLRALHRRGYFITLYPLSVANEPLDAIYSDIPREIEIVNGAGREQVDSFLKTRRGYYSTIVVSRPHNMRTLKPVIESHPDWFAGVNVVYDAEALFALREIALRELTGEPLSPEKALATIREEIALASVADQVVSVSEAERRIFVDHGLKKENTYVLGHSLEIMPTDTPFTDRSGLLFVGAVHEGSPNADSLLWFLNEVFPFIKEKLGNTIRLTIAGINTCERLQRLADATVQITGPIPSLRHLYEASRLFVAPTRYAAGVSHKVHEAAASGLPVVTTPLVAAQLGWSEEELCIGDSAESFAAGCIRAYTDETRWTAMRRAALQGVQIACSPEVFDQTIAEIFGDRGESTTPPKTFSSIAD